MSEDSPMTTAEALVAFYRELTTVDLPPEVVRDLMAQAGHTLMNGDAQLSVRQVPANV